jgi:hypothetical protein
MNYWIGINRTLYKTKRLAEFIENEYTEKFQLNEGIICKEISIPIKEG